MAGKTKTHWPTTHTLYFISGALIALVAFVIRHHSITAAWHQVFGVSLGLLTELAIGAVLLVVASAMLRRKHRLVGWAHRNTGRAFAKFKVFARKKWYWIGAWFGAGLAVFGFAQFFAGDTTSMAGSMLLGPPGDPP